MDGGFGRRPRQQRFNNAYDRVTGFEDVNGSRVVQAEVTVNCPFSLNFKQSRMGASTADVQRMGVVTDPASINIYEGQMLVKQVQSRIGVGRNRNRNETTFNVFSTFRGLPVYNEEIQNPVQWDDSWVVAGVAKSTIEMNEVIGTNEVASAMAGGMSIKTNGYRPLLAGSFLKLEMPSPMPELNAERVDAARAANVDFDPYMPSVVPERPEDGVLFLKKLLRSYVDSNVMKQGPGRIDLLLEDMDNRLGNASAVPRRAGLQFVSKEYIQGSSLDFLSNIALAARLGWVTLNIPDNSAGLATFANVVAGYSPQRLDTDLEALDSANPQTGQQPRIAGPVAVAVRSTRSLQIENLYRLFGMIPDAQLSRAGIANAREIVMLNRAAGLLSMKSTKSLVTHYQTSNAGPRRAMLSATDQDMNLMQYNRARDAYMAFHETYASQARHRFARATNTARPGAECDIVA